MYYVIYAVGCLPRVLLQQAGWLLGLWLYASRSQSRRVTEINVLRFFPDMTTSEREVLVRSSLIETARTALETPAVWFKNSKHLLTWIDNVHGEELIEQSIADENGVLLLVPHIGNWELYNAVHAERYGQFTALFKPPKQAYLANIIRRVRMHYGNDMVPTTPRGLVRLFKALTTGGTVAVLPDQVPESGIFVPFFSQAVFTDRLVHRLLKKTKAVPILVSLIRNQEGRFDLFYEAVPNLDAADEQQALTALNQSLERLILRNPSQYQWEYKRLKKQPADSKDPYKTVD